MVQTLPATEPPAEVGSLWDRWSELALRNGSIFGTWEWAWVWWQHYGAGKTACVVPLHDADGRLVGIAPLYRSLRQPLRLMRFMGHGPADELGPICAPEDREAAGAALLRWLREPSVPVDLVLAEFLPGVDGWEAILGGRVLHESSSPVTVFWMPDWPGFVSSLGGGTRRQIARDERQLASGRDVAYRVATDPERLDRDLDVFFDLHRRRWRDGSSLTPRAPFLRDFAALALARGWLRLSFLEVDGMAVASRLDFRYAGVQFACNAGREPSWTHPAVGQIIETRGMRAALEDGLREYRFLRGGEGYKQSLATEDRGAVTLALPASGAGRAATAAAGMLASRHWGRSLLRRGVDGD